MFSFSLKKTRWTALFASLVLLFMAGSLFVSCTEPDPDDETKIDAQQPSISAQPQGGTWNVDANDSFTLTVTASVTDGGQLSYQWYKNTDNSTTGGTTIGTGNPLSLSKTDYDAGETYYFYVVVTNTNNSATGKKTASATSSVAQVSLTSTLVNAHHPNITVQPQGGTWDVSSANSFTLSVTAAVTDSGTLSYQWYKNTSNSTTGGTTIGTNSENLSLAKGEYTTNGAYYFYVAVTNTINDNNDGGTKTATTTSNAVKVTVSGNSGDTGPVYYPGEQPFEELMSFLEGYWMASNYMDGYLVRKWSNFDEDDEILVAMIWDEYGLMTDDEEEGYVPRYPWGEEIDFDNLKTYESQLAPKNTDYVYAYLDEYGPMYDWYTAYFGLVRAVIISEDDWHLVIIEYFEGGDPGALNAMQGVERGTKPYFGIYIKKNTEDQVEMHNTNGFLSETLDYTEQATLQEAIDLFTNGDRLDFMADMTNPQDRQEE